eukprot:2846275-Pyramimonas_sp.AAC.1
MSAELPQWTASALPSTKTSSAMSARTLASNLARFSARCSPFAPFGKMRGCVVNAISPGPLS